MWQEILEGYDEEIQLFSGVVLETQEMAANRNGRDVFNSAPKTEKAAILEKKMWDIISEGERIEAFLPKQQILPYVEATYNDMYRALGWLKNPPSRLRQGIEELASGKMPENLALIFDLYGEFRENLAIMYSAHDYIRKRKGRRGLDEHKKYAASYIKLLVDKGGYDIERARVVFLEHVLSVTHDGAVPFDGWTREEFEGFLDHSYKNVPLKPGEDEKRRKYAVLSATFHQNLAKEKLADFACAKLMRVLQELHLSK